MDSWKEIASHFGKGITTVQRWEREESLPVHRLQHDKQGSVYAYKEELEAWRRERTSANEQAGEDYISFRVRRRTLLAAAGTGLCAVIGGAAAVNYLRRPAPQNLCHHPKNLGVDRITRFGVLEGTLYSVVHSPGGSGGWAIRASDGSAVEGKPKLLHHGLDHVENLVATEHGVYTVFHDPDRGIWRVYVSADGRNLVSGLDTALSYEGDARVDNLVEFRGGVMTSFSGSPKDDPCGIYFSADPQRLIPLVKSTGGRRQYGRLRAARMVAFRGGLMTAFVDDLNGESQGVYHSTDGTNPGIVSTNTGVVAGPLRTGGHVEMLVETKPGLVAAYYNPVSRKSWGIYLSPDGNFVAGPAGNTRRAYYGAYRPDAIVAYKEGVLSAFFDPRTEESKGIYFSPDGLNLAGGGGTVRIYSGPLRVSAMAAVGEAFVIAFCDPKTGQGRGITFTQSVRELHAS